MRSRNIKPGFFKEECLADAGPITQLLFAGLWCLADKSGLLKDIPRLIKAEVFPYYDVDVNGELTVIERLGHIRRYKVDEINIIQIVNFQKHQNPHHTEKPSTLPFLTDSEYISYCIQKENTVNGDITVNTPLSHGEYPADSLIPDSIERERYTRAKMDFVEIENGSCELTGGNVCRMLGKKGISPTNPSHSDLVDALKQGATWEDFYYAGNEAIAREKGFAYALTIVLSKVKEKHKTKNHPDKVNGSSNKQFNSSGDNYGTHRPNDETYPSTGRKLNPVEKIAAASRRLEEKEARDRGDLARAIN